MEEFLASGTAPPHLEPWASSHKDTGEGAVEWNALPELLLGPLTKPRGVFLALNPGEADLRFQERNGIFAKEFREEYGSYSAWAASWPYLRNPWVCKNGKNRHHRSGHRFLRDWCGDQELPYSAMVSFDLYPWHSAKFNGRRVVEEAKDLVQEFAWKPVAELGAPVFVFGVPWFSILETVPGLTVVERLGIDGRPYGSRVESRSAVVLQGSGGVTVIAEKHSGSAGPPSQEQTTLLLDAPGDFGRS